MILASATWNIMLQETKKSDLIIPDDVVDEYIDGDVEDGVKDDGDVDDKCWQLSRLYNGRCQKLGQGSVLATPPISRWLLFLDKIWRKKLPPRTIFVALLGHSKEFIDWPCVI